MRFARAAAAIMVAAFAVSLASAQTGGLVVEVSDSGGPMPGVTVTISHEQGYVKEVAMITDVKGRAEFPVLRATGASGIGYSVVVMLPGYAPQRHSDVKVRIGETSRLPVQLSEELIERVQVRAKSDVVDLDDNSVSTKFTGEFIADLPVPGRFYQNVLSLAPGVQDADGDGNPNVHGSRDRDFKAIVGGVSNVDPLTGQQMSQVNPNSIEEMEVITAGAGVEFRRAQGGFARILQKQGSNEFEGVVELYYRSDLLDGDGAGDFSNLPDLGFQWIQPAVQVSGPIVKDKLWYRLSHEIIDREIPVNVTNGIAVVQDEWGIHSDQLTWQASPRNKLALQYQADPRRIDNFGVSSSRSESAALVIDRGSETFGLTWTAPVSPKLLINSQVAWQDLNSRAFPTTRNLGNNCIKGPLFLENAHCFDLDSGQISGSYNFEIDDHRQRLTVSSDATVYGGRIWGMQHQFKFGVSVENERYTRDRTFNPEIAQFTYSPLADPDSPDQTPEQLKVIFGTFAVPARTVVSNAGIAWGVYLEDQVKPLQNLTITLGAAIDREEIRSSGRSPLDPSADIAHYQALLNQGVSPPVAQQQAFTSYEALQDFLVQFAQVLGVNPNEVIQRQSTAAQQSGFWAQSRRAEDVNVTNTNFSPQVSIAWDPWSNGKTKFSIGGRRFYDKTYLNIPLLELEQPTANVAFNANLVDGQWSVPPGPEGLRTSVSPSVNVSTVDRSLRTPYQDELLFQIERELWAETSLKFTYINRKYRDQYQDTDINHVPGDFGRCRVATVNNTAAIEAVQIGDPDYDPALAPGDGIIDDCVGEIEVPPLQPGQTVGDPLDPAVRIERPDGIPDLYLLNPGWGTVFLVGNINSIDYEGYGVELTRRQYRSWELQASYTYSEAFGDGEDFGQSLGDDQSLVDDEFGYQAYDQRHVVKVNATTITPWGFRLGTAVSWQSGLPYSIVDRKLAFDAVPPSLLNAGAGGSARTRTTYPSGQRNDQRNVSYWNVDLKFTKELNLSRGLNMQVSAEVFNLLNDGTYQIYNPLTQTGEQVNGNNTAIRRFGRQWQIGMKLAF